MAQASIPYAVARTRVLETRLINDDRLKRMLDAADYDSVKRALAEAGYSESDSEDYEQMINREMERTCRYVREVSPNAYATDAFLLKYDCNNMKSLLKARLLGREDPRLSESGTVSAEHAQAAAGGEYFRLPDNMAAACEECNKNIDAGTADAQTIDLVMDKACYADMEEYALKSKNDLALDCIRAQADLLNLRTFLRIRKSGGRADAVLAAMVPGGHIEPKAFVDAMTASDEALYRQLKLECYADTVQPGLEEYINTGSLSKLERLSDDYLTARLRKHRYDNFTIAPILGFLIAKEREAQAVRLVMVGKLNDVPQNLIMERLRELYEQ